MTNVDELNLDDLNSESGQVYCPVGQASLDLHEEDEDVPAPEAKAGDAGILDGESASIPDEDEKNFRIHSRSVFLTYPDVDVWFADASDMASDLCNMFSDDIKHIVIGWEQYTERKGWHAHVFIEFHHKKNIKNARFFDLYDLHPYIESTKNRNACISYCSKFTHRGWPYFNNAHLDYSTPAGFTRRFNDHQKWSLTLSSLSRKDFQFPLSVYGTIFNLQFTSKKRHFWIYGPTNCGKSTTIGADHFDTRSIRYFEPGEQAPGGGSYGTFDTYQQERLILYDDRQVSWETLQRIADYKGATPKNIGIRGRGSDPIFTKAMVIIVLSNYAPGGQKNEDWMQIPAFVARFNVIALELDANEKGQIKYIL